ncbi:MULTISPECIES: hypothetical protein [unclassified Rathayibacter]|uniref:hypothetical protein n=1 Tax=unclassified Rathayibacter TaxID=2609250 RepID=UPI001043B66B|nr:MULTISPECIES: hypothetical protein [unclassified Rathayibacter]MCJ1675571.1 hypothetical protein [Rathayibacter sp. VKM Ac-2929]TCL79516.1 hypothetical protein EDF49_111152 [Rathayibacter sp. PhB192]TCM25215.1 hypothetical protein EDF43_11143 [Rathayibacter sp. PhB179]
MALPTASLQLSTPATELSEHPNGSLEKQATIGPTTVIDPYVLVERRLNQVGVAEIADRLDTLAEVAATFGLTVDHHNHAQELLASFEGGYRFLSTDGRTA